MIEDKNKLTHILTSWPTVVSDNVVFKCLEQYRVHSIWKQPVVCCVCGLLRQEIDLIDVSDGYTGAIDFSILQSKDPHLIDVSPFQYDCDAITNTILCKDGMSISKEKKTVLNVCMECHSALKKKHIPRLALANYLYRGEMPEEFRDLTWKFPDFFNRDLTK